MARLKIMGSKSLLSDKLSRWPEVKVRGGHTVLEDAPVKTQREIFDELVTKYKFTAFDTTVPEAPVRVKTFNPQTQDEVVFVPQFAGG